jgi:hypothetical protein
MILFGDNNLNWRNNPDLKLKHFEKNGKDSNPRLLLEQKICDCDLSRIHSASSLKFSFSGFSRNLSSQLARPQPTPQSLSPASSFRPAHTCDSSSSGHNNNSSNCNSNTTLFSPRRGYISTTEHFSDESHHKIFEKAQLLNFEDRRKRKKQIEKAEMKN